MAELLRDTFTAANQPLSSYSSDYVRETGSDNESRIVDNALRFDTGGFAATEKWHNSAVTIPDGGFVQATWSASNTGGLAGITLYVDDNNKYMLFCNANELYMARVRNGSYSVVGPRQAPPFPISDGVTVKLRKNGTVLEAYYGDLSNPVYTYDNAQNDFGGAGLMPGLEVVKADLVMDNFIADDGQSVGGSDTTDPVINLNAASSITIEIGDTYTAPAVTASDDTDGDITGSITATGDDFDTSVVGGPYEVIFSVSDAAGNSSSVSQFVTVVDSGTPPNDTTPPVIALNGPSTLQITQGDTYTPPNATATDDTDGDLTSSITVTGDDFDTSTAGGPHEVVFSVSDAAGNSASVSQFVTVVASAPAVRGVLGSDIPSAGEHGPSILYPYISLPADADKRFYIEPVGTLPSGMTLEDSGVLVWDSVAAGRTEIPVTLYKDGVEWLPDGRDSIIVITGT